MSPAPAQQQYLSRHDEHVADHCRIEREVVLDYGAGGPAEACVFVPGGVIACEMVVCRPLYELDLRFTAFVLLL